MQTSPAQRPIRLAATETSEQIRSSLCFLLGHLAPGDGGVLFGSSLGGRRGLVGCLGQSKGAGPLGEEKHPRKGLGTEAGVRTGHPLFDTAQKKCALSKSTNSSPTTLPHPHLSLKLSAHSCAPQGQRRNLYSRKGPKIFREESSNTKPWGGRQKTALCRGRRAGGGPQACLSLTQLCHGPQGPQDGTAPPRTGFGWEKPDAGCWHP